MCEQTSQELEMGARLAQTLWTQAATFHIALYVTLVLQLNSPATPHIRQRGGESVSAADLLSCIYVQTYGNIPLFAL